MARSTALEPRQQTIIYPDLPLAIYREIAAHLEQVNGVRATLTPAPPDRFDYRHSQIGSLQIEYTEDFIDRDGERVRSILDYYANRHGSYRLS
ncbi:hypothetical protein V0288_03570 [Pannus brasiliensis CCIBt3594]|uniref:Uncharacterized protein n=1 Tax=Pannus brasiliensis CCIBt3594 TaxID=1427578 RepID=A0AAW9QEG0_9CHRO